MTLPYLSVGYRVGSGAKIKGPRNAVRIGHGPLRRGRDRFGPGQRRRTVLTVRGSVVRRFGSRSTFRRRRTSRDLEPEWL